MSDLFQNLYIIPTYLIYQAYIFYNILYYSVTDDMEITICAIIVLMYFALRHRVLLYSNIFYSHANIMGLYNIYLHHANCVRIVTLIARL